MDIRKYTGIIIRRNRLFLVCKSDVTGKLCWSASPYDAWLTRNKQYAHSIARVVGGSMVLFNPVAGQVREMII